MSYEAQGWAVKARVGHAHSKAVLLLLANYADEKGSCFPSHAHMASVLEVSERTIQECVKRLERDGWVTTRRDRQNGKLGITRYRLCTERDAANGDEAPPEAASGGDHRKSGASLPEADDVSTGSSFRSDTPQNPPEESVEREGARASRAEGGEAAPHVPHAELLDQVMAAHPAAAHDDLDQIHAAWRALDPADRRQAAARIADWVAAQPKGRRAMLGLPKYLGQHAWERLPGQAEAEDGEARRVAIFTRSWWCLVWAYARLAAEDAAALQFLRTKISASLAYGFWILADPAERARVDAAAEKLVQRPPDDHAVVEAKARFGREFRITLPLPDKPGVRVWLPAEALEPQEAAE